MWYEVNFKQSLADLNSKFSFSSTSCHAMVKDLSLPDYLPIAGGKIVGFIHFLRVLALCKMETASSRIWTPITVSISYDDEQ